MFGTLIFASGFLTLSYAVVYRPGLYVLGIYISHSLEHIRRLVNGHVPTMSYTVTDSVLVRNDCLGTDKSHCARVVC